jgi:hypothetical protein
MAFAIFMQLASTQIPYSDGAVFGAGSNQGIICVECNRLDPGPSLTALDSEPPSLFLQSATLDYAAHTGFQVLFHCAITYIISPFRDERKGDT